MAKNIFKFFFLPSSRLSQKVVCWYIDKRYDLSYDRWVKYFDWSIEKNELLKLEREVTFEKVIEAIFSDNLLDDIKHPSRGKFANQRMFIVNIENYAFIVPYVEDEEKIFLKTIFPSRKATKRYIMKGDVS